MGQRTSRERLALVSSQAPVVGGIRSALPGEVLHPALAYPGFWELLGVGRLPNPALRTTLLSSARRVGGPRGALWG
ncbi:MAG TPA: hypothetical protein VMG58_18770 [Candidatus Sulfotelmatobacter sp.]|nr:hypothetical protein [Anaeromyxobacteraceae bacterium]HTU03885.1 hypothetical protein [Candidatus Sulfotelmatobacter sp.]